MAEYPGDEVESVPEGMDGLGEGEGGSSYDDDDAEAMTAAEVLVKLEEVCTALGCPDTVRQCL